MSQIVVIAFKGTDEDSRRRFINVTNNMLDNIQVVDSKSSAPEFILDEKCVETEIREWVQELVRKKINLNDIDFTTREASKEEELKRKKFNSGNLDTKVPTSDILRKLFDEGIEFKSRKTAQSWILDPLNALGYTNVSGGHCFGLANMAKQSFIAEGLEGLKKLAKRVDMIRSMPIKEFENDFAHLREKQLQFEDQNDQESAKEIKNKITNLKGFFDGVVLTHSLTNYSYLTENGAVGQNSQYTTPITTPTDERCASPR
jgi:hypothetical protein